MRPPIGEKKKQISDNSFISDVFSDIVRDIAKFMNIVCNFDCSTKNNYGVAGILVLTLVLFESELPLSSVALTLMSRLELYLSLGTL